MFIIGGPTQVAQPQRAVYLECKGEIRDAISLVRNLGGPVGVLAAITEYSSQNGFLRTENANSNKQLVYKGSGG